MAISITGIDHFVLNCRDVEASAAWYERVLGMRRAVLPPDARIALIFGTQKINLRPTGAANWITGDADAPGAGDFCLVSPTSTAQVLAHLSACGVAVVDGPVERQGARGTMRSVYCRDPDGNLVEIAHYSDGG